ncbi:MAG TPA: DEAD/DEAH box helicase [Verrucomicrobium sp.]|nr:DEAD/DEAH box helicase [Verrucomicrobium sp.]
MLSHLNHVKAAKLLGQGGTEWLIKGGAVDINIAEQVHFTDEHFQVIYPHSDGESEPLVVTLSLHPFAKSKLQIACSHEGDEGSLFTGATLALILEEKTLLGLAAAPPDLDVPWELVPAHQLDARALAEREKRAAEEKMKIKPADKTQAWTDYTVTNPVSGKCYRVGLRGLERGQSYCACPDFRKNRLGTCKHVLAVQTWVSKKFDTRTLKRPWKPQAISVYARYDGDLRLGVEFPSKLPADVAQLLEPWKTRFASTAADMIELYDLLRQLIQLDAAPVVYPDAEEVLSQTLHEYRLETLVKEIRKSPATHPLRASLLKTELLPYQLDGIAFAAGRGRAVLADEMGLGKTIQGVGVAEFLARHANIQRVLVICPASLKSQWVLEIEKFSDRSSQIVSGKVSERTDQYQGGSFFTICNYEQVLRDYLDIERTTWDLIILDEAQRIKNWEAKTSRIIKGLRSPFALVLTGTPLENRLDDLYSVVEFIDDRRLGPAYKFFHGHRVASETGRVLGYKNLGALRKQLEPVLLRRTRVSIALDLPPRRTEVVRIQATEEQKQLHSAHMQIVFGITRKRFLTEMDLLRLQRSLLMARMSANSTFLVDKEAPGYSSKLERLTELLENLCAEPERKIILFTEWTTMLNLIEPVLRRLKVEFVRLDGQVAQKKRQALVAEFQTNPKCRVFLTTNAGSTGLNLQAADTVINVDLPWNPALLEQRIARAHRMGQKRKVQVYLLVTEETIEDNLLATLGAKHELAAAVLDPDSDLQEVTLVSGIDELKRRLEVLLGAKPEAEPDISSHEETERKAEEVRQAAQSKKARVSEATGTLVASAFQLLGELLPPAPATASTTADAAADVAATAIHSALMQSVETGEDGKPKLVLTLPNQESVNALANALARLMSLGSGATAGVS